MKHILFARENTAGQLAKTTKKILKNLPAPVAGKPGKYLARPSAGIYLARRYNRVREIVFLIIRLFGILKLDIF